MKVNRRESIPVVNKDVSAIESMVVQELNEACLMILLCEERRYSKALWDC